MVQTKRHSGDEVDAMLRNAELRCELEPYYDESIARLQATRLPLQKENEYLEMMLAWETAPVLPISEWFNPPLEPRVSSQMTDTEVREALWKLIHLLYSKQLVLDFTDHLSDRELYQLICRDILPSREKMLSIRNGYLHWDCAGVGESQEIWLTYYATEEERMLWEELHDQTAPFHQTPPYSRDLPRDPA